MVGIYYVDASGGIQVLVPGYLVPLLTEPPCGPLRRITMPLN